MKKWLQWIFRRGKRGTLLLNMRPGDEVVAMTQYRQWLAVMSRGGELYLISTDEFDNPDVDTVHQARVFCT